MYRYEDSPHDYAKECRHAADSYKYRPYRAALSAVQIIKACHCLGYQSCETPDWESSLAFRIVEAIKDQATYKLAGYDAAQWEIMRKVAA